ncbi:MAG: selenoneine synthase SenA [Candidatus Accumulibacter meliphilus]|jgi:iron(II)-dependent oxidoreductase|uniref:selenoneine synthase SenA n=1 Tax=Candidatus Accumulibacter meliphilus TaxID=2211374 RepID=UPI002FC3A054
MTKPARQWAAADAAREGGRQVLIDALQAARQRTLALLTAYEQALGPALHIPFSPQLNPPLWEVGHIGWFQDYWIARNTQRALGDGADPDAFRPAGRLPGADALYNSSTIEHSTRWQLPLPDLTATRAYLEASLAETLARLAQTGATPADLYFFRLVLFHEQMHAEAATYMAQALDIALPSALRSLRLPELPANKLGATGRQTKVARLNLPGGEWLLGYEEPGFAFDNELSAHPIALPAFEIDSTPVSWERYLPFVTANGYQQARYWSSAGWRWREAAGIDAPRYLRQSGGRWQQRRFGQWQPLPIAAAAVHLSWFEADAWCRWAGRRLPTEGEWEWAALAALTPLAAPPTLATPNDGGYECYKWGQLWEWTASRFLPYPAFRAHPYRDYSAPWFDSRFVLRGASQATALEMRHPRYRNYFTPERNDIFSGFRSCTIAG